MTRNTEKMVEKKVREIFSVMGNTTEAWQMIYDSIGEIGLEFADYQKPRPKNLYLKTRDAIWSAV